MFMNHFTNKIATRMFN